MKLGHLVRCLDTYKCPCKLHRWIYCLSSESDTIDTAQTLALLTDVLLGTGVAALVTGVVLLFVLDDSAESEDPTETAFVCSTDGCFGTARLRF